MAAGELAVGVGHLISDSDCDPEPDTDSDCEWNIYGWAMA